MNVPGTGALLGVATRRTDEEPVGQEVEARQQQPAVGAALVLVVDDVPAADLLVAVGGNRGVVTRLQNTQRGVAHRVRHRARVGDVRRPWVEVHRARHRAWFGWVNEPPLRSLRWARACSDYWLVRRRKPTHIASRKPLFLASLFRAFEFESTIFPSFGAEERSWVFRAFFLRLHPADQRRAELTLSPARCVSLKRDSAYTSPQQTKHVRARLQKVSAGEPGGGGDVKKFIVGSWAPSARPNPHPFPSRYKQNHTPPLSPPCTPPGA
jgi:hypothetical protein